MKVITEKSEVDTGLPGALQGLTSAEAAARLQRDGPNELPSAKPRTIFQIAFEVIREPMFLLLLGGGTIYLLLGDLQEALLLLAFVFVVIGITLYQERKTENALQALKDLSSPRARVIRDGEASYVPGRDVVRGDIVLVQEGDRIPADGAVRASTNLSVDESLLTGESVPVRKRLWDGVTEMQRPGGDDEPFVYSGTLVVQGRATIEILRTGLLTEMGKIGKSLQLLEPDKTNLQKQTGRLVMNLAIIGLCLSILVVLIYGILRGDWLHGVLAGIALAMAILPEEFPVVLTIFLALGAWRISRRKVLARRMHAVEILGSATVLCVDKTGTLTLNQMSVGELRTKDVTLQTTGGADTPLPEALHELVEYSILASQRDPFDPMEKAFHRFGEEHLAETEHLHNDWVIVQSYPLSQELLAMSQVWRSNRRDNYVIAAKGAPEAIADLCHFDTAQIAALEIQINEMAERGLRVLGVACANIPDGAELPEVQHDFTFHFLGLVGLIDPVRPSVPAAIAECEAAGIRVVMITGDYPATARTIAQQIGLISPEIVMTGDELMRTDDAVLAERVRTVNVFARVVPEQKLRLVQALQATGEVVAMTGDGVNDAPALKAADIGVAMGGRGTDVAREAAGLVLLEDDFSSIVAAVRLGRRIYDNLRKAMAYIFAIHVPIAGLSLLPVALGWPLLLLPIHIVLMELIIDPACSTVFEAEPEERNVMQRPPRNPHESIFDKHTLVLSLVQGACVLAVSMGIFLLAHSWQLEEKTERTMAFVTLIVANLMLILTNVSWTRSLLATLRHPNGAMCWVVGGAAALMLALLGIPPLANLFLFAHLDFAQTGICLAAGIGSVVWFEIVKFTWSRRKEMV
ncbi:MAG: cation-translocating P-type ATPase [bacterium]